jgi:hypothetical protein
MENQTTAQILEPLMENGRAAGGSPLEAGHYIRGFIIPALRVRSTSGATCQAQQQCGLVAPEAGSLRSRSLIKPPYVKPPARPAPEHCVPPGSFHSSCLGPPAPCLSWGGLRASASRLHLGGGVGVDQKITLCLCRAVAVPHRRPPKGAPAPTTNPRTPRPVCVPSGRSRALNSATHAPHTLHTLPRKNLPRQASLQPATPSSPTAGPPDPRRRCKEHSAFVAPRGSSPGAARRCPPRRIRKNS